MTDLARLCCFVAVRQTQRDEDILSELTQNLILATPEVPFRAAGDFQILLEERFGLSLSGERLQSAIDRALQTRVLNQGSDGRLTVPSNRAVSAQAHLDQAKELENEVRETWLTGLAERRPQLDPGLAWSLLQSFNLDAFRQHGLFTLSLVDPTLEVPEKYQMNLAALLRKSLEEVSDQLTRDALATELARFFIDAGSLPSRAKYIADAADRMVSCYALMLPEDVSSRLREALTPLTLFLDTNVLFGIVGLDDGPLVAASNELVAVSESHRLPLRLRYHTRTEHELRTTLESASSRLKGRRWDPSISRAAALLPTISTIQRLYHERNAAKALTAESFFAPFEHIDVLVQKRGIQVYREDETLTDKQTLYDMIADYEAFLARYHREKSYEARAHDMSILATVRRLRSNAASSLRAEALLVTYDALLFRFDREWARHNGRYSCAVLPTQLMQLLRAFLPSSDDFDRSFASAFAMPAFRAAGGQAHVATARMVELVASYEGLAPSTAEAVLSNRLLLDGLRRAKTDEDLRKYVDSAIAAENAALAEENERLKAAVAVEVERSQATAQEASAALAAKDRQVQREVGRLVDTKADLEASIIVERERSGELDAALQNARAEIKTEEAALETLRRRVQTLEASSEGAREARRTWRAAFISLLVGGLLFVIVWLVSKEFKWAWLRQHPNGMGITGLLGLAVGGTAYGSLQPKHKVGAWTLVVIVAVVAALGLLGAFPG